MPEVVNPKPPRRRVLFLTFHLPLPEEPGAFRPWTEAKLLRDLGCEVTVVTSAIQYMTGRDLRQGRHGWSVEEEREGIRILRVWGLRDYRRGLLRRLIHSGLYATLAVGSALFRVGGVDQVFAGTDPLFVPPAAYLIARLKRSELLLDERDLYPETAIALGVLKPGFLARMIHVMLHGLRRRAPRLLAATPGIRQRLIEQGHPPDKIRVLLNADVYLEGAEAGAGSPDRARAELEAHAPEGSRVLVLYAGGLGRANDVTTLLEASRWLREDPEIGVLIVGEGERRGAYERRVVEQGLRVRLLGAYPRTEARALIAASDLCILLYPTDTFFQGTLASKIFDYLAMGKPVVFAGSGDTATLLEESGAGVVVPAGDARAVAQAITRLARNPAERRRMEASGNDWWRQNGSVHQARETLAWLIGAPPLHPG